MPIAVCAAPPRVNVTESPYPLLEAALLVTAVAAKFTSSLPVAVHAVKLPLAVSVSYTHLTLPTTPYV